LTIQRVSMKTHVLRRRLEEFSAKVEPVLKKATKDRAGLADRTVTSFDMPECAPHEKRHPVVKTGRRDRERNAAASRA
jgi:hypothetical protein